VHPPAQETWKMLTARSQKGVLGKGLHQLIGLYHPRAEQPEAAVAAGKATFMFLHQKQW